MGIHATKSMICDLTNSSYRLDSGEFIAYHRDGSATKFRVDLVHGYSGKDHLFDRTLAEIEAECARKLIGKDVEKMRISWTNGRPEVSVITRYTPDQAAALPDCAAKEKSRLNSCAKSYFVKSLDLFFRRSQIESNLRWLQLHSFSTGRCRVDIGVRVSEFDKDFPNIEEAEKYRSGLAEKWGAERDAILAELHEVLPTEQRAYMDACRRHRILPGSYFPGFLGGNIVTFKL